MNNEEENKTQNDEYYTKDEKTAIHDAIEHNNMLKFLLSKSNIDVNTKRTHSLKISGAFHTEAHIINITTSLTMAILLESKSIDVNLKASLKFQLRTASSYYCR